MNVIAQCCSLAIMFVLIYFYYNAKKLPLYSGRAFLGIWSITFLMISVDILSMAILYYAVSLPRFFVNFVCKVYLVTILWVAVYALRYVCADIFYKTGRGTIWISRSRFFGIVGSVLIMFSHISINNTNPNRAYTYGMSVLVCGVFVSIIITFILFLVVKYKETIDKRRSQAVVEWAVVAILATIIQAVFKECLLVSFASVLGLLIIYLKFENPLMTVNWDSGTFNISGMYLYLKQIKRSGGDAAIISVVYDTNRKSGMTYEVEKMVSRQIIDFLESLSDVIVFQHSEYEFLVVCETKEDAKIASRMIKKRFDMPWGADHMHMIVDDILFVDSIQRFEMAEDVLSVFQYARQNREMLSKLEGADITQALIDSMYRERKMETEIVAALSEKRVEVFYQPIYNVRTKRFTSAEALVRIRDEEGKLVPPGEFISVAEKRGLIIRLGEYVFEDVCRFIVEQRPYEYGVEYIEVNLSILQCQYEHLADDFIEIMRHYHVDAKYILLEITESATINDKPILLHNMNKLKEEGIRFALDDFGTGQSNLNYIVDFPVDVVKFDSGMINSYFENGTAKYVMDAAMQMIQGMNLKIVSEGIEEKYQYSAMKDLGIDFIQGYYFSKPIPEDKYLRFIKNNYEKRYFSVDAE